MPNTSPRKLLVRTEIDGVPIVVARKDLEDEEYSDPCFFDDDYSCVSSASSIHRPTVALG